MDWKKILLASQLIIELVVILGIGSETPCSTQKTQTSGFLPTYDVVRQTYDTVPVRHRTWCTYDIVYRCRTTSYNRLAAPAERRGGFGTCAQSGRQGDQRTQPYLSLPAHRLSARPDPTRRTHNSERGAPSSVKRTTIPRAALPQRDPPARTVPRSGPTSQTRDSSTLRLGPATSRATWLSV